MKRVKKLFKFFGIGIALLIGIVLVAGQVAHYTVPTFDPPGEIYSVNGMKMHMYCTGPQDDRQPTIILIAGAGTQSPLYYSLQENLSKTIRTCTYDRAGTGWSDASNIPATAKNMSDELYHLLQAAKIDGSVILAGHSLGGVVSLIYSAEHEEHVAGIVFIDSSHYNQYDYFGKEFSDTVYSQNQSLLESFWLVELVSKLGIMNLIFAMAGDPEESSYAQTQQMLSYLDAKRPPYDTVKSEISNLKTSFEQGKEAHYARGDLPIVSLSASNFDASFFPKTGPTEKEIQDAFKSFHKELAELSSNGQHVIVNDTDHISIIYHEDTTKHILSLVSLVDVSKVSEPELSEARLRLIELLQDEKIQQFNELKTIAFDHPSSNREMEQRLDLREINLEGKNLENANLFRVDLQDANLKNANLQNTNLVFSNMTDANLGGANIVNVMAGGVILYGANLENASFQVSNLVGADLRHANLDGANFQSATLENANLQGVDLQNVELLGVVLKGANLRDANMQGVDLHNASLDKTMLIDTNLKSAKNLSITLEEARQRGAIIK